MSEGVSVEPDRERMVVSPDRRQRIVAYTEAVANWGQLHAPGKGPLRIVATGDSWFDYPLDEGFLNHTDVIAQLRKTLAPGTVIGNIAKYGDTAANLMGQSRREELRALLMQGADAILFSGGGNDLAGDQFRLWLDQKQAGADPVTAIDETALGGILAVVSAAYRDLVALRDAVAPGVPILVHGYDFAIPDGDAAKLLWIDVAGPWLEPSLVARGWMTAGGDASAGAAIVKAILLRFRSVLASLAGPGSGVHVVPTQGVLGAAEWANELHPTPEGFAKEAERFAGVLRGVFPGRLV